MRVAFSKVWRELGLSLTRIILNEGDVFPVDSTLEEDGDSRYITLLLKGRLGSVNPNREPSYFEHVASHDLLAGGTANAGVSTFTALEECEYICFGPVPLQGLIDRASEYLLTHISTQEGNVIDIPLGTECIIVMNGFLEKADATVGQGVRLDVEYGADILTAKTLTHVVAISKK